MATAQATSNAITLKGSAQIVAEFFGYAVNSILYQRGIYPPETFDRKKKYGLTMLVTQDTGLAEYLTSVMAQIEEWLEAGTLQKLVLVVTDVATGEVLERWQFDMETDRAAASDQGGGAAKSEKEIHGEIAAIIRQITASVTFLPLLEDACTFDLLVYTDSDSDVPTQWEESDPRYIQQSAEVRLRSFTTKVHKVDALVAYKQDEDEDAI